MVGAAVIGDRERAWEQWNGTSLPAPPPGEHRAFNAGFDMGYRQAVRDRSAFTAGLAALFAALVILVLLGG